MQSDLVIKENELIDPADYPEEQHSLVNDFNARIRRLTGIITGIGKEYHTIWVINANIQGSDILAGFKNVDDIVASAKERMNCICCRYPSCLKYSERRGEQSLLLHMMQNL